MEAVDLNPERVTPFFHHALINIVGLTTQLDSSGGSQIAVAIYEKHSLREIMILGQSVNECSG